MIIYAGKAETVEVRGTISVKGNKQGIIFLGIIAI
jgi:hypothetical protein